MTCLSTGTQQKEGQDSEYSAHQNVTHPSAANKDQTKNERIRQAEAALFRFFGIPAAEFSSGKTNKNEQEEDPDEPASNENVTSRTDEIKKTDGDNLPEAVFDGNSVHFCEASNPKQGKTAAKTTSSPSSASSSDYYLPPPPHTWPQRPVFIRATPGSSTQIVDIRPASLLKHDDDLLFDTGSIPMNTGDEQESNGNCFVVDFVSKHFIGTLLVRVNGVPSLHDQYKDNNNNNNNNNQKGSSKSNYFEGRQRTFQGVVKGRFQTPLKLDQCVTGQVFRRPAGTLPAHWIIHAFEALVQRLAPHNELHMEGPNPMSLAPIVTTAQTIVVHPAGRILEGPPSDDDGLVVHDGHFFYDSVYREGYNIEEMEPYWQEPSPSKPTSLIYEAVQQQRLQRQHQTDDRQDERDPLEQAICKQHVDYRKHRKQFFNRLFSNKTTKNLQFATDKEYTFEFYDHLVVFDREELCLDLKLPFLHNIKVAPITDGQPIQFMSAVRTASTQDGSPATKGKSGLEYLWNFEIWHESLYPYACKLPPFR